MTFQVAILSTRCQSPKGMIAIENWLESHGLDRQYYTVVKEKPPALLFIDDRAVTFDGTWPSIEFIKNFKPWNKR